MFVARPTELAIGGLAAGLLISGTVALSLAGAAGPSGRATAGRAEVHSLAQVVAAGEVPAESQGGADAGASFGAASGPDMRDPRAQVGAGGAGGAGGATAGAQAAGVAAANRPGSSSRVGASVGDGGSGGTLGGGGGTGGGNTGGGGGTGGGNTGGSGGNGGGTTPGTPGLPAAPTVAAPESLHSHGSFTVAVPPTSGVSKQLCLSGEVDHCQKITLPATPGTTLRVSYSGNASAKAPTFTPVSCRGGTGVTVSGVTPGTIVTVEVGSARLSVTLRQGERSQTASLCDA